MQEETLAAVAHIQTSREAVGEGLVLGEEVRGALARIERAAGEVRGELGRIEEAVGEVARYTDEIGAATREQALGGAQVEREMTRLSEIAREIQKATREQAAGASEVVKLAERMREVTQQNAASAVQTNGAAVGLARGAEDLHAAAARFQLPAEKAL
jgi:methyl-accepting chemotaxis protein